MQYYLFSFFLGMETFKTSSNEVFIFKGNSLVLGFLYFSLFFLVIFILWGVKFRNKAFYKVC